MRGVPETYHQRLKMKLFILGIEIYYAAIVWIFLKFFLYSVRSSIFQKFLPYS
jgi:hypothetical protein